MPNNITLKINGRRYDGWSDISITKSLFSMVGSFGLAATDIYPSDFQKWGFSLGDACTVEIDKQTIINGYIESIPISYDANSHTIQISGRDRTCDLVDCSFTDDDQEWKGQTVAQIIRTLCSPFDIDVVVDSSVDRVANKEPIETFHAQMGMTIFEMILPILQEKGILAVSYADGKLTLTRSGTNKASDMLILGKNIKSGSINQSITDRFRYYIVKGQGNGNDNKTDLKIFTGPYASYLDVEIARERSTIIFSDNKIDADGCNKRAKWEAANRAGKSVSIEYEVQDWVQSNGQVWPLNSLVRVKDKMLGINGELLIASIDFGISEDSGKITRMILVDPKTFDIDPTAIKTQVFKPTVNLNGLIEIF